MSSPSQNLWMLVSCRMRSAASEDNRCETLSLPVLGVSLHKVCGQSGPLGEPCNLHILGSGVWILVTKQLIAKQSDAYTQTLYCNNLVVKGEMHVIYLGVYVCVCSWVRCWTIGAMLVGVGV